MGDLTNVAPGDDLPTLTYAQTVRLEWMLQQAWESGVREARRLAMNAVMPGAGDAYTATAVAQQNLTRTLEAAPPTVSNFDAYLTD